MSRLLRVVFLIYVLESSFAQITAPGGQHLRAPRKGIFRRTVAANVSSSPDACEVGTIDYQEMTWVPYSWRTTTTITAATVVYIVNQYNNNTRTETITNANATPTDLNRAGTRVSQISVWDGSRSIETTIAYPTGLSAWGQSYYISGLISTTVNGVPTRLSGTSLPFTFPSNPPAPSTNPSAIQTSDAVSADPQGLMHSLAIESCGPGQDVFESLFPSLGLWKCNYQCAGPVGFQATALYLTHTTTSTDTGNSNPKDSGQPGSNPTQQLSSSVFLAPNPDGTEGGSTIIPASGAYITGDGTPGPSPSADPEDQGVVGFLTPVTPNPEPTPAIDNPQTFIQAPTKPYVRPGQNPALDSPVPRSTGGGGGSGGGSSGGGSVSKRGSSSAAKPTPPGLPSSQTPPVTDNGNSPHLVSPISLSQILALASTALSTYKQNHENEINPPTTAPHPPPGSVTITGNTLPLNTASPTPIILSQILSLGSAALLDAAQGDYAAVSAHLTALPLSSFLDILKAEGISSGFPLDSGLPLPAVVVNGHTIPADVQHTTNTTPGQTLPEGLSATPVPGEDASAFVSSTSASTSIGVGGFVASPFAGAASSSNGGAQATGGNQSSEVASPSNGDSPVPGGGAAAPSGSGGVVAEFTGEARRLAVHNIWIIVLLVCGILSCVAIS